MTEILNDYEQDKIVELSWELREVYEKYKIDIENIIHNNYWSNKEDELLSLFKKLGISLSDRNNELLVFFKNKYWLDFKKDLDLSWWIKINIDILDDWIPSNIKSFLSWNYTRKEGDTICSRWYWYYFNFPGLSIEWHNYKLNVSEYIQNLSKYYEDTLLYLSEFEWKKLSDLDEKEKKVLLIWLEHYKNILLYLQNFLISISDKQYLNDHVLNISKKSFDNFFIDVSKDEDFSELNNFLKKELEIITSNFWDILLWINVNSDFNISSSSNVSRIINVMQNLYEWSFEKQKNFVTNLENKNKNKDNNNHWKKTEFNSIFKSINRSNNKLIWKLSRIIREEDNPLKQLLACHNISQNIPKETKWIDVVGVLYWWIEMPYFMKYILTRFWGRDSNDINIDLLWLSAYSNRNLKQTSALSNYKPVYWRSIDKKSSNLQVILDDNSFYWTSLQVASNVWSSKGPVYSWVAEVGLRRGSIWKLEEWSNISHLLSKVADSASVTPIEKNRGTYRNMINRHITKKLPWLVGNF